jgi:hypothetical protein
MSLAKSHLIKTINEAAWFSQKLQITSKLHHHHVTPLFKQLLKMFKALSTSVTSHTLIN